jgi:cyanoexosortase A
MNRLLALLPAGLRDRIPPLPPATPRNLWLLTASLVVSQNLWVIHITQRSTALLVFALVCWWGALTCMEDRLDELRPHPSLAGMVAGLTLLGWSLWRSGRIVDQDGLINLLPLIATVALALLCDPIRHIGRFREQFIVMALLPMRIIDRVLPEFPISLVTAKLAAFWLTILGLPVVRQVRVVSMGSTGVSVEGPCNGLDQILFLMAIAVIFLIAFPLRRPGHRLLIVLAAPLIALIGNSFRIALLAMINTMEGNSGRWWFDFFHIHEGSLIFMGISSSVLGWFYLKLIDRELGPATDA